MVNDEVRYVKASGHGRINRRLASPRGRSRIQPGFEELERLVLLSQLSLPAFPAMEIVKYSWANDYAYTADGGGSYISAGGGPRGIININLSPLRALLSKGVQLKDAQLRASGAVGNGNQTVTFDGFKSTGTLKGDYEGGSDGFSGSTSLDLSVPYLSPTGKLQKGVSDPIDVTSYLSQALARGDDTLSFKVSSDSTSKTVLMGAAATRGSIAIAVEYGTPPDILVDSVHYEAPTGNVIVDYTVTDPLTTQSSIALYWARGTGANLDDRILTTLDGQLLPPPASVPLDGSRGTHTAKFTTDMVEAMGPQPVGATMLMVVADPPLQGKPDGLIDESNEGNNLKSTEYRQAAPADLSVGSLSYIHNDATVNDPARGQLYGGGGNATSLAGGLSPLLSYRGTAIVKNVGGAPSKATYATYWSSDLQHPRYDPSSSNPSFRVLAEQIPIPPLEPGESYQIPQRLMKNPVVDFQREKPGGEIGTLRKSEQLPLYDHGFVVGITVDPNQVVPDTDRSNNDSSVPANDPSTVNLAIMRLAILVMKGAYSTKGSSVAAEFLGNFLDKSGTAIRSSPLSNPAERWIANKVASSKAYDAAYRFYTDLVEQGIRANPDSRQLHVTSINGTKLVPVGPAYHFWFRGTRDSSPVDKELDYAFGDPGEVTAQADIRVTRGRRRAQYTGQLRFTIKTLYTFDVENARNAGGDYIARELQVWGNASPFIAEATVVKPLRGSIDLGPAPTQTRRR